MVAEGAGLEEEEEEAEVVALPLPFPPRLRSAMRPWTLRRRRVKSASRDEAVDVDGTEPLIFVVDGAADALVVPLLARSATMPDSYSSSSSS